MSPWGCVWLEGLLSWKVEPAWPLQQTVALTIAGKDSVSSSGLLVLGATLLSMVAFEQCLGWPQTKRKARSPSPGPQTLPLPGHV